MQNPVFIGGSAGSFRIISNLVSALPKQYSFPIIICVHRLRSVAEGFVQSLENSVRGTIKEAEHGEPVKPGIIYVAPADRHLEISSDHCFSLTTAPPINFSRPSIDITFASAASRYGTAVTGIILTGANTDGTNGMREIYLAGGITIVQDPAEAEIVTMPQAVLNNFTPDHILSAAQIIDYIVQMATSV
ncbi:MAG: chemotaxis protein CheB [Bacteroidales bacterium]